MVRSTWDYAPRREEFLGWSERVGRVTELLNSAAVLRWNTDKTYLRELAGRGVPVVPTGWLLPGGPLALPDLPGDVVVKPTVSAGARDTGRFGPEPGERAAALALAQRLLGAGRGVMVQPYIDIVDVAGERALVFVRGRYTHAVRKGAILTGRGDRARSHQGGRPGAGLFAAQQLSPTEPTPEEIALAEAALRAVPFPVEEVLYARVDVVTSAEGPPLLLELELTEPSLFLRAGPPEAAAALAGAITGR